MPHDVFLSYASTDRVAAEAICTALETRGIRCWIAPRDVPAGADWGEAILTAIGRAHAMVLVLSRTTANSVHVRNEVVTAVSQSLAMCPVRIEDCQPSGALRLHLAGSHWINVFPLPVEQHADVLAAGVRLALAADATIEIPRAQVAALMAAARASHAVTGAGPMVAAAQGMPQPGWPASAMARPAPRAMPSAPPAMPVPPAIADPAAPRRAGGLGIVLAVVAAVLLVALGAAAWLFEPRLRALLGAGPREPVMLADAAPSAPLRADPAFVSAPAGPALSREIVAPPPPILAPRVDDRGARLVPPAASLAGLGGSMPLPQAAAPPPVPPASRFTQAPPSAVPDRPQFAAVVPAPSPPPPGAPPPAAARVMNAARETISRLFVAPMNDGVGRDDWLGNAQITPGNAVQIRPPQGQGCVFNIRAVYVGGRTEDRPGVNLCAAPELRFEGGKGAGAASSR